ncbi:hypothetical protein QQF64_028373 [Cirrhinus molitorella]|uniref:Uncharacterized protein n=1 Tax=Cirrhinus molitorella TaxID=172907 RepID=A0ABR3N6U2_9TELE
MTRSFSVDSLKPLRRDASRGVTVRFQCTLGVRIAPLSFKTDPPLLSPEVPIILPPSPPSSPPKQERTRQDGYVLRRDLHNRLDAYVYRLVFIQK